MSLYSTTIITVTGTVLPLGQTAAILAADFNLTVAALPAIYQYSTTLPIVNKPTLLPSCSATSIKKELPALEYMDKVI